MIRVMLAIVLLDVIPDVQCESDSTSNDHSVVQGIAARCKIGFPPTVLKVFVKDDIQADEIEKLINLCIRQNKLPNDSKLTRSRRNSISDYIGKLYSFNSLFRPYRSIFRRLKQTQTTRTPWLKKFLRGVPVEPKTENFWGIALGAHTFSPFERPLAKTGMPYHRMRNQQRIDRLLGITKNYGLALAFHNGTQPGWLKTQEEFHENFGRTKSLETTVTDNPHKATSRHAFHKIPLDVAGLKNFTLIPHLNAINTPRRLKFCKKQCINEGEEPKTKRPTTKSPAEGMGSSRSTLGCSETTESCTCIAESDCLCDKQEVDEDCKCLNDNVVTKKVAQTKHATHKSTTIKIFRSTSHKGTGLMWTLSPSSFVGQAKTTEQRRTMPDDETELISSSETTSPSDEEVTEISGKCQNTCKHGSTKQTSCIPMPIPTRVGLCPKSTRGCKSTTTADEDVSSDAHDCHSRKPPSRDIPISVEDLLESNDTPCECNKGKSQKIIVRISSALGEIPVVIMRDNGVSGVSLSLVNDYLLNENNKLIKCLGRKPLSRDTVMAKVNGSVKFVPPSKRRKEHFLPNSIRSHLHRLQPRRYSFRFNYNPSHLVSGPRASVRTDQMAIPKAVLNQDAFSDPRVQEQPFLPYKWNLPNLQMQYPIQNARRYHSFKMNPIETPNSRLLIGPIPQMHLNGFQGDISLPEYPRFKIHSGIASGGMLPRFEPGNLQQVADTKLMSYQSPFLPLFYPNRNFVQPPKYLGKGL